MKNLSKNNLKIEILFKKMGFKLFLLLFLISRILDSFTTEVLLDSGYHEHYENFIFYSIENHMIGYLISGIIMLIIILIPLLVYYKVDNNIGILKFRPLFLLFSMSLFFASWIPVINNALLILGIFPPAGIQFYPTFTIILIIVSILYGVCIIYNILLEKERSFKC